MKSFFDFREDFQKYSKDYRLKEIKILKDYLGNSFFKKGLELGAGSGFQSIHIRDMFDELTVTDLNDQRLQSLSEFSNIKRIILDSEKLLEHFDNDSFDFIYSSNHLEHLPNPDLCIDACFKILKNDGICIHILPNPTWRLFQTVLHYPNKFLNLLNRISFKKELEEDNLFIDSMGNNMKSIEKKSFFNGILFPKSHGVSSNFLVEHYAFRKHKWINLFEKSGFTVIDILKGPISSGYGYGLRRTKKYLEKIGVSTEYFFILKK